MKFDPEQRLAEYESVIERLSKTREPLNDDAKKTIYNLVQDLDNTEDPVFHVNCLQLIADLACSEKALEILEEKQVPQKLISILQQNDPLIVTHALKFFYRVNPTQLETKYPTVLDKIYDYCQDENKQLVDYAIDIIAAIGRGGFGARKVLSNHPHFTTKCLHRLGSLIISSDNMIKSRTLKCIHDLLELHEDDPQEESAALAKQFYFEILSGDHQMTNQLLALCRYPFEEIRVNALLVIATISAVEWGQKELASSSNFLGWILDRSTEKCKDGKEAKFEILKTLVKSKTTTRHFKGEDYMKMRADFKKGPFHVEMAEEMLMDEQAGS